MYNVEINSQIRTAKYLITHSIYARLSPCTADEFPFHTALVRHEDLATKTYLEFPKT